MRLELNEVDFSRNIITIPAKKMKSKRSSVKKMTKLARATIEEAIAKRTGPTNYVLWTKMESLTQEIMSQ